MYEYHAKGAEYERAKGEYTVEIWKQKGELPPRCFYTFQSHTILDLAEVVSVKPVFQFHRYEGKHLTIIKLVIILKSGAELRITDHSIEMMNLESEVPLYTSAAGLRYLAFTNELEKAKKIRK